VSREQPEMWQHVEHKMFQYAQ